VTDDKVAGRGLAWRTAVGFTRRRKLVVIASAAVLAAGLGTGLGLGLTGPAVPQWCRPLLGQLEIRSASRSGTSQGVMSALGRIETRQHAPIGKLISDLEAQARSGNNNYLALDNVITDLRSLNRACGQPPDAYAGDIT
jgi:hypothetical protein